MGNIVEETKERQIKGERQIKELADSVVFLSKKIDEYEEEKVKKDKIIKNLQSDILTLKDEMKSMAKSLDRQHQYSRCNCILLHGVQETANEDTDAIAESSHW